MGLKQWGVAFGCCVAMGAQADLSGLMEAVTPEVEALVVEQVLPTGTAAEPLEAACNDMGLAGGWHEFELTPEIEGALTDVLNQMDTTGTLSSILSVRSQVVAGVNYLVDFELDNGEVWSTKIFQDLAGHYSVVGSPVQGPSCP